MSEQRLIVNLEPFSTFTKITEQWTREFVKEVIDLGAKPYMAYHSWPDVKDMIKAYPEFRDVLEQQILQPSIFTNQYIQEYVEKYKNSEQ